MLGPSQSFDKSKKGRVRLDEFISICIFVQSARYVHHGTTNINIQVMTTSC
jgi:hypothetical protein